MIIDTHLPNHSFSLLYLNYKFIRRPVFFFNARKEIATQNAHRQRPLIAKSNIAVIAFCLVIHTPQHRIGKTNKSVAARTSPYVLSKVKTRTCFHSSPTIIFCRFAVNECIFTSCDSVSFWLHAFAVFFYQMEFVLFFRTCAVQCRAEGMSKRSNFRNILL